MGPTDPADATVSRPAGPSFIPELDAFRAVAILSVMAIHWLPHATLVNRVQDQTTNGVHLFFVLSGFLITRILLQSRAAIDRGTVSVAWSLRQFYARRALRIFPVYYLVLAVAALFAFPGVRTAFWWDAGFLSNAFQFRHRSLFDGPASVFWTLSVEEQFYLLWPLAMLMLPRRAMVPFVAVAAVVGMVIRCAAILRFPLAEILMPSCANFLAAGALVAVVDHPTYGSDRSARRVRGTFVTAIAGLLVADGLLGVRGGVAYLARAAPVRAIDQTAMSMAYALLFAKSARGFPRWISAPLRFPPLAYLGRISYGLYIYHLFVTVALDRLAQAGWAHRLGPGTALRLSVNPLIRFAATVAVASASWHLFERPINELKRYFPYSRPQPAAEPEPGVVRSRSAARVEPSIDARQVG